MLVGKNERQTMVIATASTDIHGGMCTDYRRSLCMDTLTREITSKDAHGITCMEDCVSACMDATCTEDCVSAYTYVYTDITGVHGSMCTFIYTKCTDVHVVISTDKSNIKTVIVRANAYDEYGRYKPLRDIGTDVVWGKVRKGIRYVDAL